MKKRLLLILSAAILCILLSFGLASHADFGGFSGDSDYGGGSDWGSSSWDDLDLDSDYSGGGIYIGGLSVFSGLPFVIILIVAVLIFVFARSKKVGGSGRSNNPGAQRTNAVSLRNMSEYLQLDPAFNSSDMQSKLSNLYVQMQNCWEAKDIEPIRPYLTDMLYSQSESQLNEIRAANQTNRIDRIAVLGVDLRGWFQREGQDHIIVEMRTRITTYTTDDSTGEVVRGDRNAEKFMTYEWDVCRASGIKTGERRVTENIHCPSCGAPVSINQSAKCPYCDSVITVAQHDWVLSSIKGISQRTRN